MDGLACLTRLSATVVGRAFGGSRDWRWQITVSVDSLDTVRPREGPFWRWADVCTACMWQRPPGRKVGIRRERLAGKAATAVTAP